MIGLYKIAERIVHIHSVYPRIHASCREYQLSEEEAEQAVPEISIQTTEKEIEAEKTYCGPDEHFPDDYYEELAVHRQLATAMLDYDTFLFHGSCVAVDGKAYIFTAPSGTGKSTHVRLWREYLGDRAQMVNDDKPLIRITEEGALVYGTPYNGKHRLGSNICVPLKAICLLARGAENHIEKTTKEEAYPVLSQQTYRPEKPEDLARTLTLLDKLTYSVNLYKLRCNMEPDAARVSYEEMHGKSDD